MLERSSESQVNIKQQKIRHKLEKSVCKQAKKREKMLLERNSESQVNIKQQKVDAQMTQAGEKCVQTNQKAQKKR